MIISADTPHYDTLDDLLPLVRRFSVDPCGIALGGSFAKGDADHASDLDIYLFGQAVLPPAGRNELVSAALGAAALLGSWGSTEPFVEGGTDLQHRGLRIECWLRNSDHVEAALDALVRGETQRTQSIWAVMGFFSHVLLADVHSMQVVEDPYGTLSRWKAVASIYPEPLRNAIVSRYVREATFWPGNPHYASAVDRGDVFYTTAIVQRVIQALFQVVFALNRTYFPGEKRLALLLQDLAIQPLGFAQRAQELVSGVYAPGESELRRQRSELQKLVAEVEGLVAAGRIRSSSTG